jgi:uncharacterized Fe-S cluster-containing MiaB family protein
MKVVILNTHETIIEKLTKIVKSADAAGDKSITLFSTGRTFNEIEVFLNKSAKIIKVKYNKESIYTIRDIMITLEEIDLIL